VYSSEPFFKDHVPLATTGTTLSSITTAPVSRSVWSGAYVVFVTKLVPSGDVCFSIQLPIRAVSSLRSADEAHAATVIARAAHTVTCLKFDPR
jgi:hypothetical protein